MNIIAALLGNSQSPIAKLEAKLAETQEAVRQAQHEANAAFLSAEDTDTPAAKKAVETARAKLDAAQNRMTELSGALLAARDREREEAENLRKQSEAQAWAAVAALCERQNKSAKEFEAVAAKLVGIIGDVRKTAGEIYVTIPSAQGKRDFLDISAPLQLEHALRLHLCKLGASWAILWPWGAESIRPFREVMGDATNAALKHNAKEAA